MEFLKDLFGDKALTYDQLSAAVKDKGLQVVNAAGGAYVSKADADSLNGQVTTLTTQLGEANKKLEGYDPTWKDKAETAEREMNDLRRDFAIDKALTGAGAKNAKAVKALLDQERMTFAGGEVIGLDKQLEALKKGEDTAFLFQEAAKPTTGFTHQGGREVAGDKREEANEAFRAAFGKEQ